MRCRDNFTLFFCSLTCSFHPLYSVSRWSLESVLWLVQAGVESSLFFFSRSQFTLLSSAYECALGKLQIQTSWADSVPGFSQLSVDLSEHYSLCSQWSNAHIWLWACFSSVLQRFIRSCSLVSNAIICWIFIKNHRNDKCFSLTVGGICETIDFHEIKKKKKIVQLEVQHLVNSLHQNDIFVPVKVHYSNLRVDYRWPLFCMFFLFFIWQCICRWQVRRVYLDTQAVLEYVRRQWVWCVFVVSGLCWWVMWWTAALLQKHWAAESFSTKRCEILHRFYFQCCNTNEHKPVNHTAVMMLLHWYCYTDTVTLTILHVSLSELKSFTALSLCWEVRSHIRTVPPAVHRPVTSHCVHV